MGKRALAIALAAGLALAAPAAARVPAPWSGQLSQQLAVIEARVAEAGFARVAGPLSGGLQRGEAQRFSVALIAGGDYRIVGVCDNDCSDLDLRILDQNGQLIEEDISRDDHPVVTSQPAWSGPFTIEARMYECQHPEGCYFALNVYGRERAVSPARARTMPRA
ncbi:MAG: hypothetical protein GC189_05180 [Alphaproteobacteria bacterium]|nr:hypothetical protein [Alphaproteobacteria bacterium]